MTRICIALHMQCVGSISGDCPRRDSGADKHLYADIQVLSSACMQGGYGAGLPPPMLMPQAAAGGMQGLQAVPGYQAVNMGIAPGIYAAPQHMHMPQQYNNPQPPAPHMNGSLF